MSVDRRVPWPLALPAALGAAFLLLPLVGLLWRTPWSQLPALLAQPTTRQALWLSVSTATVTMVLGLVLGVPLAWVLARGRRWPTAALRSLVTLPLVFPPVVGGVALLAALGRTGLVGRYLYRSTGYSLPFTTPAVVLAQLFVAMPFLVVTVEGALRAADDGLTEAAATLGASPMTILRRVTLPMVAPAIGAGAVLCWARALGEFGATITFAGNFPGTTQTLPLAVYQAMETSPDSAIALSIVLLVVSVGVLVGLRDRWLRVTR